MAEPSEGRGRGEGDGSAGRRLKVMFAGTPEFAAVALAALLQAGHDMVLVATQPDRPAGRGLKLQASPVKQLAVEHGVPVMQPAGLKLDGKYASDAQAAKATILAARPDIIVVAAYGLILPQWVLDAAPLGCLNIHGSLLPRWRGAAPIHRAIEAGDATTGITVMQMDAGLDTGDMLLDESVDIDPGETTGSLHDKLAALGGRLIVEALALAAAHELRPVRQPEEGVTYAHKISKHEAAIDWSSSSAQIERRLRAFDPFPGASTTLQGELIKCWRGVVVDKDKDIDEPPVGQATSSRHAGELLDVSAAGIVVACGPGGTDRLLLTELQRPGGKRQPVAQILQSPSAAGLFMPGRVFGEVPGPDQARQVGIESH